MPLEEENLYDDQRKSGTNGMYQPESVCLPEQKFEGQGARGKTMRYPACFSKGQRQDSAFQVLQAFER